MFVALRDLQNARGRFVLMSVVIVLITFLVTFLASLTAGLARESTSAVTDLPADRLVFAMPNPDDAPAFTASQVTADQWQEWAHVPGVQAAEPLGVATTRAESTGTTASVTALGVAADSALAPEPVAQGTVLLTTTAAEALGIGAGETVMLSGRELLVAGVAESDASFSHTPAVWTSLADWQAIGARGAGTTEPVATVVALTTAGVSDVDLAAADSQNGTTTLSRADARSAVSSFAGENTSLTTMQGFLLVISALVVGAFFSVWTISRSGDIAVLKALGASTGYLVRDALGQAAVLLIGGVALGTGLAAGGAALLPEAVPVTLTAGTTLVPAASLIVLGLLGAGASVARITGIDPHAALAAR